MYGHEKTNAEKPKGRKFPPENFSAFKIRISTLMDNFFQHVFYQVQNLHIKVGFQHATFTEINQWAKILKL